MGPGLKRVCRKRDARPDPKMVHMSIRLMPDGSDETMYLDDYKLFAKGT